MKRILFFILLLIATGPGYAQWQPLPQLSAFDLFKMQMTSATRGYIAATDAIYATNNGGSSWGQLHYIQADSLYYQNVLKYSLYFFNNQTGVVVGYSSIDDKAIVMRTTNGGTQWTTTYLNNSGKRLYDVWFTSATNGIAVGKGGLILKTIDGGITWTVVSSPVTADLLNVHFDPADPNVGLISADGYMLRTTNGGTSWTSTSFPNVTFSSVNFAATGTAYACGDGQTPLYKTTNGGASWQTVQTNVMHFDDLFFLSADTGYACGDAAYKTTNGGITWEEQPGAYNNLFIYFYGPQLGFTGGYEGTLSRTINAGGNLWRPIATLALTGNTTCNDSMFYFNSNYDPRYTYTWLLNNQVISTHVSDSAYTPSAGTSFTLKVIVSNGVTSDTASQTFNTAGPLAFNFPPPRHYDTICRGSNLHIVIDTAKSGISYQLYTDSVATGNAQTGNGVSNLYFDTYAVEGHSLKIVATKNWSCGFYQVTQYLTVTVSPTIVPVHVVETAICSGDVAQIEIQNSQPGVSYRLYLGTNGFTNTLVNGNGGSVYLNYTLIANQWFTVKAIDNARGCELNYWSLDTVRVRKMYLGFSRVEDVFVGQDIQLQNTSNGDTYRWGFDPSAPIIADTAYQPVPISYSTTGNKEIGLRGFTVEGCDDTVSYRVRVFQPMDTASPGQVCAFDTIPTYSRRIVAYHVDRFGNQYVAGYTSSTLGAHYTGSTFYYFLQKFDKNGQLKWEKKPDYTLYFPNSGINDYYGSYFTGITTDPFGNIYVCGNYGAESFHFEGGVVFNPTNSQNFLIAKYDSMGHLIWGTHSYNSYNSGAMVGASDIMYVDEEHIYVSIQNGTVSGYLTLINPDGSPGVGMTNSCVMRLGSDGWLREKFPINTMVSSFYGGVHYNPDPNIIMPSKFVATGMKMHLRNDGKIVLTGLHHKAIQFGSILVPASGSISAFVALLNPATGWEHAYEASYSTINGYNGDATPQDRTPVSCVDRNGNVYMARTTQIPSGPTADVIATANGQSYSDSGVSSCIMRYSPTGQLQWMAHNSKGAIRSLAVSDNGDKLYAYGEYDRFIGFTLPSAEPIGRWGFGNKDAYLTVLDSSGTFAGFENIGGDTVDGAYLMYKDCGGIINCLGYSTRSAHVKTNSIVSGGYKNFVLKYDPANQNCQRQTCPAYVNDYRTIYNSVLTSNVHDTLCTNLQVIDSQTVFGSVNSIDTIYGHDTLVQIVPVHFVDTVTYSSVTSNYDSVLIIYYTHHLDSIVYFDSTVTHYNCTYLDTMHIIRTVIPTTVGGTEPGSHFVFVTPNPASTELRINMGNEWAEQVNIFNTEGKLVLHINQPVANKIDIAALSPGVYMAEVRGARVNARLRWVKM